MNSKQKAKRSNTKSKGGLDNEQILVVVGMVQEYWPNYSITAADIRTPTGSFVLKFYKDCTANLDDKIKFVTRSSPLLTPPLYEEEILYLKLCKIPTLVAAQFKLGDLYAFEPKRLSQYMFITMHFLNTSENLIDKMVQIYNESFDVKDKQQTLEENLNKIREDKLQAQINLTLSNTQLKKDKELTNAQIPKYKETLVQIQIAEAKCKDSILEAEGLRNFTENLQEEIEKLERTEAALNGKILQEDHYKNLEVILRGLEKDEEDLIVDEEAMDLLKQKQHTELIQNCIQEAKHLELEENLFKLATQREKLNDITNDVENIQAIQENTEIEIIEMKKAFELQRKLLEEDLKLTATVHQNNMEKKIKEEKELKNQYLKAMQENVNQIEDLKITKSLVESEYKMMENFLSEQSLKLYNMHKDRVDNFMSFLSGVEKKTNKE